MHYVRHLPLPTPYPFAGIATISLILVFLLSSKFSMYRSCSVVPFLFVCHCVGLRFIKARIRAMLCIHYDAEERIYCYINYLTSS